MFSIATIFFIDIMNKLICLITLSCLAIIGCKDSATTTPTTDNSTTLVATVIASASAPDVNSATIESAWDGAAPITVSVSPIGTPFTGDVTPFSVSIKAVRTDQDIYFLAEYDDASQDMLRQPLKFNGGNFSDEKNWSFEDKTYDDGFSFIFERDPGTSGAKTFGANGCTMLCHETKTAKWDAGMFPESEGRYDLWYWNAGKSNGCGFADDKACLGNPNFGIVVDEPNKDIYGFNVIDFSPGFLPFYIAGGTNGGLDKRYFITESSAVAFGAPTSKDPSTGDIWKAGALVPGYTIKPYSALDPSSYYDVKSKGYYSGGKWHVKFKRKLNTNQDELDVTFAPGNSYGFSFAVHNHNAPGNHYGVADKMFTLKL